MGTGVVKTYTLLNPDGVEVAITNLKKFCRENGLHYPKINQAAHGISQYHGWKTPDFVHLPLSRFTANNIQGCVFGRLTAVRTVQRDKQKGIKWLCQCTCGNQIEEYVKVLGSGKKKSCGCLVKETRVTSNTRHGYTNKNGKKPEYVAWTGAINRCENENDVGYPDYGGRGIKMCAQWRSDFRNFIADMGDKPEPKSNYSIERVDVNGDYESSNCIWATRIEQNHNQRRYIALKQVQRLEQLSGLSIEQLIKRYETASC